MSDGIIIIGSGHAGGMTGISLRQKKYEKPILIIGAEKYYPYQRPALSKGYLLDQVNEDSLYLKTSSWYKKQEINIELNKRAKEIKRESKVVILEDGEEHKFEKIVIATGSKLNRLQFKCHNSNIFYLRTIDDAIKIKDALNELKDIAIIGAGYIGLEIASSAVKKNKRVTVIEMGNRVMGRSISKETSIFLQNKHESEGVNFQFNTSVKEIEDNKKQKKITCTGGETIVADCVILGLGVEANTDLAIDAGIICNDGIVVDEFGITSDPNIYAAGDCTNHPNNILNRRLRLESVHNAVEQAKTVASSIIGKPKAYNQVPWFWSDQYNIKIQIAGISEEYDDIVKIMGKKNESYSIFYFKKNRLLSVESINHQKGFLMGKRLIKERTESSLNLIKSL